MNTQQFEDIKKASLILNRMFEQSARVAFNVIEGFKTFDELATPFTSKDIRKVPQSPRLQIKHTQLAEKMIEMCTKKEFTSRKNINTVDFSLLPLIQSGGFYSLDVNGSNDQNYFKDDVFIICLRLKYKNYCSVLIRTIMITPNKNINLQQNYDFLLRLQKLIFVILKDGVILGEIYKFVVNYVKQKRPELLLNLTDNFGSRIGEEPKNDSFIIEANSKDIVQENMIFNVNIGLHAIYDPEMMEQEPHVYSLWIGDCVQVQKEKAAIVLQHTVNETQLSIMRLQRKLIHSDVL